MWKLMLDFGKKADAAINAGMTEYDRLKGACTPEQLAAVVLRETASWKPTLSDKEVLTPGLRLSLAKALAGLAYNIAAVKAGNKPI